MRQFFSLLYRIVDIVSASNVYMLQEERYVLKEDYIYCSEDGGELFLTYIPKEALDEKNTLSADLQHLAARLVHKVSELSGGGYQELMNYLTEESFNLPVLKQLLLKHMNSPAERSGGMEQASRDINQPVFSQMEPSLEKKRSSYSLQEADLYAAAGSSTFLNAVPPTLKPPAAEPQAFQSAAHPFGDFRDDETEQKDSDDSPHKKLKLPVLLIGLLGLGLVWKLYLDHQNEGWLYICLGLSLLVTNLVFIILWIWKAPVKEDDEAMDFWQAPAHINASEPGREPYDKGGVVPFFTPQRVNGERLYGEPSLHQDRAAGEFPRLDAKLARQTVQPEASEGSDAYYRSLDQRTTMLSPPDRTVLLSGTPVQAPEESAVPCLEWSYEGTARKAAVKRPAFVIGRGGPHVDLEHNENGISRMHAEIVYENENYKIKDLGSRNGTSINGEILVPYRMYSLQEGDIVKIVNTEFVFKMGLQG